MRQHRFLPIVLILCVLPACSGPNLLDRAAWLEGQWENRTPRGTVIEEWSREGPNVFAGRSFMRQGEDIRVLETIRLVREGENLYYIPVVGDQNDGQPVRFTLTELTDRSMRFENPDHDFPQVITYSRIGSDSLMAQIAGTINGEGRSVAFPMRRVDED